MQSDDDKTRSFIALIPGAEVGHYRIVEKIGAGGMGEVYLALDTKLNRKVALKFLPLHLCQDEFCRKRFTREAQAAAALDHPNIAAIYEVGEHNGRPFFAMQIIEGQSLKEVIAGKDLPLDRILDIAIQICEGLQAAHEKGIIHRDIKPSNILLDSHGRVRIVDFGLASVRGSEQLTKTGSTLGTIGYMSPEQIRGDEIDQRSDLFSFGVVLYELITKQNPFKRDSETATLKAVLDDTPEPLARYKNNVPDELQRIISKLLQKELALRYPNIAAVVSDIKGLMSAEYYQIVTKKKKSYKSLLVPLFLLLFVVVAYWFYADFISSHKTGNPAKKMLAVLPFENLGSPENEYFADGITEELISRLASVGELGVISRTSTFTYKKTSKTIPEIAKELGVDYILEGTIRWDKSGDTDMVRITPQLIDVQGDIHVWSDRYDCELNNIFKVQSDIAENVVRSLDVVIGSDINKNLNKKPTDNIEAYDYFLQGNNYASRGNNSADMFKAIDYYEKAIELDSNFASAYSAMAKPYIQLYSNGDDPDHDRLSRARQAIDKAFEIDPDLIDGHMALAYYHFMGYYDYDPALNEINALLKKRPSSYDAVTLAGQIYMSQGKWDKALMNFREAAQLNPRSISPAYLLAAVLFNTRQWEDAMEWCNRAASIYPLFWIFRMKAEIYIRWKWDIQSARKVMAENSAHIEKDYLERVFMLFDYLNRDYKTAIERYSTVQPGNMTYFDDSVTFFLFKGKTYAKLGDHDSANACFDSVRLILEPRVLQDTVNQHNRFAGMDHCLLGLAYAYLGRKQEAIELGRQGKEITPVSKEFTGGIQLLTFLAEIYAVSGEMDEAISTLDYLMSVPGDMSLATLKYSPDWDPLRDNPRFKALIKKYENNNDI